MKTLTLTRKQLKDKVAIDILLAAGYSLQVVR